MPAMAIPGEDAAEARRRIDDDLPYLLLTDQAHRPIGWIPRQEVPTTGVLTEAMATPMSPLFNRRATLKDALSLLLDSDVQTGIVVDRRGAVLGIVTADTIAERMRGGEHVVPSEPFPTEDSLLEAPAG
jgi:hypothetical protein